MAGGGSFQSLPQHSLPKARLSILLSPIAAEPFERCPNEDAACVTHGEVTVAESPPSNLIAKEISNCSSVSGCFPSEFYRRGGWSPGGGESGDVTGGWHESSSIKAFSEDTEALRSIAIQLIKRKQLHPETDVFLNLKSAKIQRTS